MRNLIFLVIFVSATILPESGLAADRGRSFWQKRQKSVAGTQAPADEASQSALDPQKIEIPEQYGTIIETHRGTNNKLIIHIQDAHCNYEGQINEANILESLINDYDLNLILKESKLTDRDFKYLRPRLPVEERKEVAEELLRDGYITGVNYLDLGSDYPITIQGLEDKELYDNNISALWEIDRFKDLAGEYVIRLAAVADAIKPKIYNNDLLGLDNKKKAYDNEEIDLLEYYEYLYKKAGEQDVPLYTFPNFQNLIKASELEKKIDLVKIRDGSASDEEMGLYDEYLEATKDLNINSLFKEEPLLEEVLQDMLATTHDQKRLIRVSKALSIMKNLLRIKVVPEEYNYFVDNSEDFDPAFWTGFLKEKSQELGLYLDIPANSYIVSENLPKIKKFYKLASDREKVFLKRTKEHMNKERADLAALVAGGFHTPTLTRLLADAGYSYIVVSPKVTTETDEALYRWALKMDWIPELKGGKR